MNMNSKRRIRKAMRQESESLLVAELDELRGSQAAMYVLAILQEKDNTHTLPSLAKLLRKGGTPKVQGRRS